MTRPSYKKTLFDRHGPEAAVRIKATFFACVVFGLSLMMFMTLFDRLLHFSGFALVAMTLLGAGTLAAGSWFAGMWTATAVGDGARYVTAGGSSTPYEEQFSQEQALVMKRDYAAALALFEQRLAQSPGEPRVRIAAADLYATHGANPTRAAELYREVQRIPELASGHDIYVSNRLADLCLGPLDDPGRALVQFRRLVERYPGTTAADHARRALTNVKERIAQGPERPPEQPW
jgi:hypothetical protein